MTNTICIGIIGNFFGHLSAAERVEEHPYPNGIFVIHREHAETLSTGDQAMYPPAGSHVDIEPEFVVRFRVEYADGKVSNLHPLQLTIGNDFTIRKLDGSEKISQRKAWGEKSKGINQYWWDIKGFTPEDYGQELKLVSYIERDGKMYCATPLVDCTEMKLFHQELIDWMVAQINGQKNENMYEPILPVVEEQGYPEELILFTGAPNYSDWGEENFIERGDNVHIVAFNEDKISQEEVESRFIDGSLSNNDQILSFVQKIV